VIHRRGFLKSRHIAVTLLARGGTHKFASCYISFGGPPAGVFQPVLSGQAEATLSGALCPGHVDCHCGDNKYELQELASLKMPHWILVPCEFLEFRAIEHWKWLFCDLPSSTYTLDACEGSAFILQFVF
jgi:hypothetical protein